MKCNDFPGVVYFRLIAFGKKRENKTHGKISHSTVLSYDLFHVFCSLERLEDEFYNCVRAMDVASFGDIIKLSFMIYFMFSSALSD